MSSNPSDSVSELLKLLLAQQQQQPQAAQFAAPASSYQQQPEAPDQAATNPSVSQLMDYLRTTSNTAPAPAPPKPKPEDIHAQLQRYLQNGSQQHPNEAPVASVAPAPSPAVNYGANFGIGASQNGFGYQQPPPVQQPQVQPPPVFQVQQAQAQQQPSIQSLLQGLNQQHLNLGMQQQQQQRQQQQQSQQEENILASIKLLAEINPGMAAAALTQALSMAEPSQTSAQPPQQQVQQSYQPPIELHSPVSYTQSTSQQVPAPSPFGSVSHQLQQNPASALAAFSPTFPSQAAAPMNAAANTNMASKVIGLANQEQTAELPQVSTDIVKAALANPALQGEVEKKPAKKESKARPAKKQPAVAAATDPKTPAGPMSKPIPPQVPLPPLPAAAAAVPLSIPIHTPPEEILQHWNLEQLEMHVQKLKLALQPIPRHAAVLLFNARRKEEKLRAKRISNRKSASAIRAKKKMFIETLTKHNATLRKTAFILQRIPDLVIATNLNGDITFCGSQVEQYFQHKIDDLVGSNIQDIVVPESRRNLQRLFRDLLATTNHQVSGVGSASLRGGSEDKGNAASTRSFPMLEVNVDAMQPQPLAAGDDVSDSSADKQKEKHKSNGNGTTTEASSLTRQKSSFGTDSSSNENGQFATKRVKISNATISKNSDGTQSGSLHRHKELTKESLQTSDRSSSCTASSESQSPEDTTSSSGSSKAERGEKRGKQRRLVPVYKVRFVRGDLSTVWCELTSSFCTKSSFDEESSFDAKAALAAINNPRGLKNVEVENEPEEEEEEQIELLICIRPTYESERVSAEFRFIPKVKVMNSESTAVSDPKSSIAPTSSSGDGLSANASSSDQTNSKHSPPLKKRPIGNDGEASPSKKHKVPTRLESSSTSTVNAVAESLLALNSKK